MLEDLINCRCGGRPVMIDDVDKRTRQRAVHFKCNSCGCCTKMHFDARNYKYAIAEAKIEWGAMQRKLTTETLR